MFYISLYFNVYAHVHVARVESYCFVPTTTSLLRYSKHIHTHMYTHVYIHMDACLYTHGLHIHAHAFILMMTYTIMADDTNTN